MKKSLIAVIALLFSGLSIILSQETHIARECWWEILIELTSKGSYTLEETGVSYAGSYDYTIQWSGCMEQDGEDFILYYEDSELVRWTPLEKMTRNGREIKTKKNFSEKPGFAFNYILKKEENILFDFLVRGFHVPQHSRSRRYYLHLPASKENSYHPTDIAYNLHIYKGSNQVYFSKDALLDKLTKKDFHWSWKRHSSDKDVDKPSFLTHSYDVDVEITIHKRLKE